MTRRVVTFSQNLKLEYPDLWFSGEKIGLEKKRSKERKLWSARLQTIRHNTQGQICKSGGKHQRRLSGFSKS